MAPPESLPLLGEQARASKGAEPATRIKRRALELGFDAAGIARVTALEASERYERWLALGRHGAMAYLASERHRERRADPAKILPGVRSMICVALCHEP